MTDPTTDKGFDLTGQMMAYEEGQLDEDQMVTLFQRLVDNGMAWTLQGHYGRVATALIEDGRVLVRGA